MRLKHLYWAIPTLLSIPVIAAYCLLKGSCPQLSGKQTLPGLSDTVLVDRDGYGVVTLKGHCRLDLAKATGFVHAQERFFQMDLMRRMAGGEMAELFGAAVLELDKERRFHGFRKQAQKILPTLSPLERSLITAYTEGINQGLQSLRCNPFEYYLLRSTPAPWKEEDSILVGLGLFFDLQDSTATLCRARGIMKTCLPADVYDFFIHNGSAWEAPLDQSHTPLLAIPGPDSFQYLTPATSVAIHESPPRARGSNQWAVQASKTAHGHSLIACDMHLNLFVPNIWYRLGLKTDTSYCTGITLPGTPFLVAGSNQHIAWGFTNGYVDTTDLVLIDLDPANPAHYLTPHGSIPFEERFEKIAIKGAPAYIHKIVWTEWGPVDPNSFLGKPVALRWIAHDLTAFNFRLMDLEAVQSVDEALQVAKTIQLPVLNFMVADKTGHIGWSFMGSFPEREGYLPGLPVSYTDGTKKWAGTKSTPFIIDPPQGFLWTANNRVLDDPTLGFDQLNGIRAYQIHKRLSEIDRPAPQDMSNIQLDDEVIFLKRWQTLLLQVLPSHPIRSYVATWDGHCAPDSKGYVWIRTFRDQVKKTILQKLLAPCFLADPNFNVDAFDFEEPIYLIASQKPAHLCNWGATYQDIIRQMLETESPDVCWGNKNLSLIHHPLSAAIPYSNLFLNMPKLPLTGDWYVPRLAGPSTGASMRMVVSPGHEEEGLFNMPCGQTGHPLSPHYRDQHAAWLEGKPMPFLPGPCVHRLLLK